MVKLQRAKTIRTLASLLPPLLWLSRLSHGAAIFASDAPAPAVALMASPAQWVEQLMQLNRKENRAAAANAYLSQLAMIVSGAGLHCGYGGETKFPMFTGSWESITSCMTAHRTGQRGHRSWGVSMAGLGRMASIVSMIEDVGKRKLNGSFAETGVWRGGMSIVATAALQLNGMADRPVYLCDSFHGLPLPRKDSLRARSDSAFNKQTLLKVGVDSVLSNFDRYGVPRNKVTPVVGFFVDSMPKLRKELIERGERLSVLRLDGDMYDSTVDVLYNLYDLLEPGGYLVVDDFGWPHEVGLSYGARDAILDFRGLHNIEDADHAIRDIDGAAAYWIKAREVELKRDRYLESLIGHNQSKTLTPPNHSWRSGQFGVRLVQLGKRWKKSWSPLEKERVEALTKEPNCTAAA